MFKAEGVKRIEAYGICPAVCSAWSLLFASPFPYPDAAWLYHEKRLQENGYLFEDGTKDGLIGPEIGPAFLRNDLKLRRIIIILKGKRI